MLYENYQKRIKRLAGFLSILIKLIPWIISLISAAILIALVMVLCTGLPGKIHGPTEIFYGDAYQFEAKAFRSQALIEYSTQGTTEWSSQKPTLPGEYLTRAVGTSAFGKAVYGRSLEFTISPRKIDVEVDATHVMYGEIPPVTAETVYSDTFSCNNVIFGSFSQLTTKVKADANAVTILDTNGNDISFAYELNFVESDITFKKRTITVTVESASKDYDNTPLSLNAYALTDGKLAHSDSLGAVFNNSITDVGSIENTPIFQILHNDNGSLVDVTQLYDIITVKGTLTVSTRILKIYTGSCESMYSGQVITCKDFTVDPNFAPLKGHTAIFNSAKEYKNAGSYANKILIDVVDENNVDKTANYAIYYIEGSVTITQKPVTITTYNNQWVYDGQTHPNFDTTASGLINGHTVVPDTESLDGLITDVGSGENKISVFIYDEFGNNVSENYTYSYVYGTLTVTPRPVIIKTVDAQWVYDGNEHSSALYVVLSSNSLVFGHTLVPTKSTNITDVGTKPNIFSDYKILDLRENDKTFCYIITLQSGTLKVTPRTITVKPDDTEKVYDGAPLVGGEVKLTEDSEYMLVDGHTLSVSTTGSLTDAGTATSIISNVNIQSNGVDVTRNYNIQRENGMITIHKRSITILTGSAEKHYDGTPLTYNMYYVPEHSPYTLIEGHEIIMTVTGSITNIGETPNTYSVSGTKIVYKDENVTKNYKISYESGTLKVLSQAIITVKTNSDVKIYDGNPLVNKGYETSISGKLQAGHSIYVDVYGSITNAGTIPNYAIAKVFDSNGKDVSASYSIIMSYGTLEVVENKHNEDSSVIGLIKTDKSGTVYLKKRSYGDYNGRKWLDGVEYSKVLPNGYGYNYLTSIALKNIGLTPALAQIKDTDIFMLPYYLGFNSDYGIQQSDVKYSSNLSEYNVEYFYPISSVNGYEALKGNLLDYSEYEKEYRAFVYENYLTVDEETSAYLNTLIANNKFTLNDPNVIQKVVNYIQNAAAYSSTYDLHLDYEDNVVISFLDEYKEGNYKHFASAATLLYRALGIPARYVSGWMVDTVEDQYVNISNPAHAWVEVYIDDLGWVMVETTNRDPNAPIKSIGGKTMGKPTITLTPKYTYGIYNKSTQYALNEIEMDEVLLELLRKGYTYKISVLGLGRDVGRYTTYVSNFVLYDPNGIDVTNQFNYSYVDGILDIFDAKTKLVKVYLFELQKIYDGNELAFGSNDYSIIDMESGLELELSLNIKLTNAGIITLSDINKDIPAFATYKITQNGIDVTSKYTLIFDTIDDTPNNYIPLRISEREIGLSSATEIKMLNFEPLTNSNVFISKGSLANGDTIQAFAIGYISNIGSVKNDIHPYIVILNSQGDDVTSNYTICFDTIGTLTIVYNEE